MRDFCLISAYHQLRVYIRVLTDSYFFVSFSDISSSAESEQNTHGALFVSTYVFH